MEYSTGCNIEYDCVRGICNDDNECHCPEFWGGTTCNERWSNIYNGYDGLIIFYGIYVVILQGTLVAYAIYQFQHFLRLKVKWTVTTIMLLCQIVAGSIRVIEFAIDPHAYREIIPTAAHVILFNIPIILWVAMGFMLMLYWVELQTTKMLKTSNVMLIRLRPVLYGIIAFSLILIPISILWAAHIAESVMIALYNGFIAIALLFLIICFFFFGRRLMAMVGSLVKNDNYKSFLKKVTRFTFLFSANALALIIVLTLFTILDLQRNAWGWISAHLVLRTLEFLGIGSLLSAIGKKKPQSANTSKGSSNINMEEPSSNTL